MKLIFVVSLLLLPRMLHAQDVNYYIAQARQYETAMNDELAIAKYKEGLKVSPTNVYSICKISELCSRIGGRLKDDKENQARYFSMARMYAYNALKLEPFNSESNFVMALVMGREAIIKGGREKIMAVKDVKKYADRSIKYNPDNFKAWYVLGKWYYEVSALNYLERTAVRIFFGALPKADITDAINCFEKSKSINPGFILNYLSLAKAYRKKDEISLAKRNLALMISLPDEMQDDAIIKAEGRELLKKLN